LSKYLFYHRGPLSASEKSNDVPDVPFKAAIWRPSLTSIVPPGAPRSYAIWSLFHFIGVFSNPDYAVCLVSEAGTLAHRCGVFPRYFRFPFMGDDDLQLGDLWTRPDCRGQGLAPRAVRAVLTELAKPSRNFWYVVEKENAASIRVVEKMGFTLEGEGSRANRFGLRAFGFYLPTQARGQNG